MTFNPKYECVMYADAAIKLLQIRLSFSIFFLQIKPMSTPHHKSSAMAYKLIVFCI